MPYNPVDSGIPENEVILKITRLCLDGIDEFDYRFILVWTDGNKLLAKTITSLLEKKGILRIEQEETEDYLKCLEKAKKDKRVKNPSKKCHKEHPSDITVKIDCGALMEAKYQYQKLFDETLPKYPFYYYLLFIYPYEPIQ